MNRQRTDNKRRYDRIVWELRKRYPPNSMVTLEGIRVLMEELDLRMSDRRTQDKYLRWLESRRVYGPAVLEIKFEDVLILEENRVEGGSNDLRLIDSKVLARR